jgi:hypothetical protein
MDCRIWNRRRCLAGLRGGIKLTAEPGTDAFYKEFRFEVDSLQGNINRMCVTDSTEELSSMRNWAHSRINLI